MKLARLLSIFPQLNWGHDAEQDVLDVTQDSRAVKRGSVFVAIRGASGDGHHHLEQAAGQGAAALVVEDPSGIPKDYSGAVVKVPSTRQALDRIAERFFGEPAKELFCIGVTGTNGKTTVTYMIEALLTEFGWPTGVLGTIDHHLGGNKWPSSLTTPDPLTLQRRLKEFVSLGAHAAAFEVSSHALSQHRADSLPFAVGIFTNFTRDHLDYHGSMEDYFAAKERLFAELLGRHPGVNVAVLNADDAWVRRVRLHDGVTAWWYGKGGEHPADFSFRILKENLEGTLFHLATPRGNVEIQLPCPGPHNVYNATAAAAAALAAGASLECVQKALSRFHGAPGRLERVGNSRGLNVFVDYAHTDDALSSVLRGLSDLRTRAAIGGRIITVFGCGGDRDRGKRALMARAAARFSDSLVITSDNPRSEDPLAIIADIRAGIPNEWNGRLVVEPDRRSALTAALSFARSGDIVLVAGKGHEDYQIIGDKKLNFSDVQVLRELLDACQ